MTSPKNSPYTVHVYDLERHPGAMREQRLSFAVPEKLGEGLLSVAEGALNGIRDRPIVLKRFVDGAEGEPFYQKRAPENRPDWLRTVTLSFQRVDEDTIKVTVASGKRSFDVKVSKEGELSN